MDNVWDECDNFIITIKNTSAPYRIFIILIGSNTYITDFI